MNILKKVIALIVLVTVFFVKLIAPHACDIIHTGIVEAQGRLEERECDNEELYATVEKSLSIIIQIPADQSKNIHVVESFLRIKDERFAIASIKPLYEADILKFNKDLYGDGQTAYFVIAKLGGFEAGREMNIAEVTIKTKLSDITDLSEVDVDLIIMRNIYINDKGEPEYQSETDCDKKVAVPECVFCDVVGDFNEDGKVTGADLAISMSYLGARLGDFDWFVSGAHRADINGDNSVDIEDLRKVAYLAANPKIHRTEEPVEELEEVPHDDSDSDFGDEAKNSDGSGHGGHPGTDNSANDDHDSGHSGHPYKVPIHDREAQHHDDSKEPIDPFGSAGKHYDAEIDGVDSKKNRIK